MSTTTGVNAEGGRGFKVIGTRPIRHDGLERVTGKARYGADISFPGLLHAKILRSPHAHARIKSIDASRALALPGVKAVVTSADLPELSGRPVDVDEGAVLNPRFLSNNVLAANTVLYRGHAVAAVAADNSHIAKQALSLIDVDYEPLPAVLDGREAMEPGAPILHERLYRSEGEYFRPGGLQNEGDDSAPSNIASHFIHEIGDPQQGFEAADVVLEREFRTKTVHHGYVEPHTATAIWNQDGKITIWDSSQGHFAMRDLTAQVLGIPVSQIKVVPMEIGGGFGGKQHVYGEPVAALLSKKTGRPVQVTMDRTEEFEGTGPTSATYIKARIGATREGKITAAEALLIFEAGAYPGSPVYGGARYIFGPYDIPNVKVEGYDVVVNKPKVAPYRAPGGPSAGFAGETLIDELSEILGIDPLEFRLRNGAKEGTRRVTGPRFRRIGNLEVLQAARDHPHYRAPLGGPNRGRGVASAVCFNIGGPSCASVLLNRDGTVSLVEGSPDLAASRTAVAMQVAEVLGVPAEDVHPSVGDTDTIGFTGTSVGSSVTYKTGWVGQEAARDLKDRLLQRVARIWDVPDKDVEMADGEFVHHSDRELRLTLKQLAEILNKTGGPVVGYAAGDFGGESPSFSVHIVDVEVDPETGKTRVLRYTAIQDPGTAVHPNYVEGQIQGGAVQGIGWALNEEYFYDEQGRMQNATWLDYRMPTSSDLPMIDTQLVEVPDPTHPAGVRGVGEVSIIPPVPAIANAIYRAVGVRMTELPMSPGAVLSTLWQKEGR